MKEKEFPAAPGQNAQESEAGTQANAGPAESPPVNAGGMTDEYDNYCPWE